MPNLTKDQWRQVAVHSARDLYDVAALAAAVDRDGGPKLAPVGLDPEIATYQTDMTPIQKAALRQAALDKVRGVVADLQSALDGVMPDLTD